MAEAGEPGGPALVIYGASEASAALRHEVRVAIMDPFLFARIDGRTHVMVSTLERSRVEEAAPGAELHDLNDLGISELRESGLGPDEIALELTSRAAAAMGLREARRRSRSFPLAVADRLRADGDRADARPRRVRRPPPRRSSAAELDGIRARAARGRGGDGRGRGAAAPRRGPTATGSPSTASR